MASAGQEDMDEKHSAWNDDSKESHEEVAESKGKDQIHDVLAHTLANTAVKRAADYKSIQNLTRTIASPPPPFFASSFLTHMCGWVGVSPGCIRRSS